MNILHTSDWHLGRMLYHRKRYDEFEAFLNWLIDTLQKEAIDILLIAGDVFDNSTPSNRAQALYYQFLNRASQTGCRHIVIIGGNHDSPSFLNAPNVLLQTLNIHVIGAATDQIDDEIITLYDPDNQPEAVICAVPYLRDKDLRTVEAGESITEKHQKLLSGIADHYESIAQKADLIAKAQSKPIPVIAMGHLFAAGGKTVENDGVRELYVGTLAQVTADTFSETFDYVALGHLHVPQNVGGDDRIRYSGSPIPMGFGEANQTKQVIKIEFKDKNPDISTIDIPCFQKLMRLSGELTKILNQIETLKAENSDAWLEVELKDKTLIPNLQEQLYSAIENSQLEILKTPNRFLTERILKQSHIEEQLEHLNEYDVFERCLDANEIEGDDRQMLTELYGSLIQSMHEDDHRAE